MAVLKKKFNFQGAKLNLSTMAGWQLDTIGVNKLEHWYFVLGWPRDFKIEP